MSTLLQISDTHFGTERQPVVKALAALSQRLQPDLLVLSGDITQRATQRQFRAARAFMDSLDVPMLAIPGNHDIPLLNLWARWRSPYAHYAAAFGDELEPVHEGPGLMVLCVNTTRAWRHKNGEVSSAQVDRVAARLASASAAQLRVVVVHQPAEVDRPQDVPNRLRGHAQALARWAAAGADVVMGGHIHLPYVMAPQGLARPLWVVQAGTAVSARVRSGVPNSVNVLSWDAEQRQAEVAQWDYAVEQGAFVRARVTLFKPPRGGAG